MVYWELRLSNQTASLKRWKNAYVSWRLICKTCDGELDVFVSVEQLLKNGVEAGQNPASIVEDQAQKKLDIMFHLLPLVRRLGRTVDGERLLIAGPSDIKSCLTLVLSILWHFLRER